MPTADPDRFVNFASPGAQEWWYFDAISDDGRDALVLVWYAGLPFDPDYGVGTLRHLRNPSRHPAPHALDHCAVGLSWYRDGRTVAYALNGHRRAAFAHRADPFRVAVASSAVERDAGGYTLHVDTPAVDGRSRIAADLRLEPAPGTEPIERDLGPPGAPHLWMLAAADARVSGRVALDGPRPLALEFRGRGYHDHNAGAEEISLGIRRWQWGRVHLRDLAHVYYVAEPRRGDPRALWITCRDGRPESVREDVEARGVHRRLSPFGVPSDRGLILSDRRAGRSFGRWHRRCVDDGPFYRRWLSDYRGLDREHDAGTLGLSELLDTRNLNRRLFNWMIPYRLKRPSA